MFSCIVIACAVCFLCVIGIMFFVSLKLLSAVVQEDESCSEINNSADVKEEEEVKPKGKIIGKKIDWDKM